MIDASMTYLRQFAPAVLAAVRFAGGPGTEKLLQAVAMLAELFATGARKVPAGAPVGFVSAKWADYPAAAAEAGDANGYRHYWELRVLVGLRDGLRRTRGVLTFFAQDHTSAEMAYANAEITKVGQS